VEGGGGGRCGRWCKGGLGREHYTTKLKNKANLSRLPCELRVHVHRRMQRVILVAQIPLEEGHSRHPARRRRGG
jgi:hypothetical protein